MKKLKEDLRKLQKSYRDMLKMGRSEEVYGEGRAMWEEAGTELLRLVHVVEAKVSGEEARAH